MKTMKTNFNTIASKGADMGKHLTIFSIIFGTLFVSAQSRIGSGDQGVLGLLASTTRQIVPESEVVVGIPDVNSNERILVTADGPLNKYQQGYNRKYCVVLMNKHEYASVDFDTTKSEYRICAEVGTAVYIKGDYKIAIQFSGSIAFFEKKNDEALIVKLSKIQIPESDKADYSIVTRDLTNEDELNKLLYTNWLDSSVYMTEDQCDFAAVMDKGDCAKYIHGEFSLLKKYLRTLPDQNLNLFGRKVEKIISEVGSKGGIVYALPGVYKITWFYKDSNAYQVTTGIILK